MNDRPCRFMRDFPLVLQEVQHVPHVPEGGMPLRLILLGGQGLVTVRGRAADLRSYSSFRERILDALGLLLPRGPYDDDQLGWQAEVGKALARRSSAEATL